MILDQCEPALSWTQILEHQRCALFRKGGIINFAARPAFAVIGGLLCYAIVRYAGTWWLWVPALFSLFFAVALYRRYRLIVDTATSRVSSGAQGYVELEGQAWLPDGETYRGLAHLPVTVWLPGYIEDMPFYLADDAGRCLLYPGEAEVVSRPADNHLYWLHAIYPGQPLYVLGDMRTDGGENMRLSHSQRVSELLAQWKSRPGNLLEQFDASDNGQLDPEEWAQVVQSARRLAEEDIRGQRSRPGTHIIDSSAAGRWFLITNIPPEVLAWRYRLASWAHSVVWLGLLVAFY